MSDAKNVEVKPEIESIAAMLRKSAKVNAEKHVVEFDENVYKESLPEGLDEKTVKQVAHHNQNFALAQTLVTGELAIEHLKENADVPDVRSTINIPAGKTTAVVSRSAELRNIQTGEVSTKYGYTSTRISMKVPGSQTIAVRNRVAELAVKAGIGVKA